MSIRTAALTLACSVLVAACAGPRAAPSWERGPSRLPGDEGLWIDASDATVGTSPDGGTGLREAAPSPALPGTRSGLRSGTRPGTDAAASAAPGRYTVRPGDSLTGIARRLTGDAADWRELARANAIVDPAALEPGTVLVVPEALRARGGAADPDPRTGTDRAPDLDLDLLGALARAQRHDATFLLERERFAAARAGVTVARSGLLPQLNANAEIVRNTDFDDGDDTDDGGAGGGGVAPGGAGGGGGRPGAGTLVGGDYTQTTLAATLEQPLFDRPARLGLERARIDADVAGARLVGAHEALVLRVARRYFDVLAADAELDFRDSDLQAIGRQLNRSEREYAVGTVSITDVVEARARRDLARAQLIDARDGTADARAAFVQIVGLTGVDGEVDPAAFELQGLGEAFALQPPVPADPEAWVALALEGNARLVAARGESASADTLLGQQRARRLPTLSAGASVTSIDSDGPIPATEVGTLGLTGTLPILSGGRVTGLVAQAGAEARAAGQQLADARRTAVRDTRDGHREVVSSIARVRAFEQALTSTGRAAEATEAGFRAGIRTSVEVLEAQRDRFRAQADLATARYGYIVASLELQRRAGTLEAGDVRAVDGWLAPRSR